MNVFQLESGSRLRLQYDATLLLQEDVIAGVGVVLAAPILRPRVTATATAIHRTDGTATARAKTTGTAAAVAS